MKPPSVTAPAPAASPTPSPDIPMEAPPFYDTEAAAAASPFSMKVATADVSVRLGFLRKVYSILTLNFLITTVFSLYCTFNPPVRAIFATNRWIMVVALVVALAAMIALACVRIPPPNSVALLAVYVGAFTVLVGSFCARYFEGGWGGVILQAFVATAGVFLVITMYVMLTKKEFSYLGSFLGGALVAFLVLLLCTFAFRLVRGTKVNRWVGLAISIAGVLLMLAYLLYDTSLVVHRYGPDDWVIAVVSLYTDVMNIFLFFTSIFSFVNS